MNAINYYKMASDNGEAAGSYSMGIVYHFGLYGNSKNEDLAIRYYKKGIEQYSKEMILQVAHLSVIAVSIL